MTYQQREAIFSKEAISLDDMCLLLEVCKSTASQRMSEMKRVVGDRLGIQGKIHVQDYLDYMQIKEERMDMYKKPLQNPFDDKRIPKSVCFGGIV